MVSIAIKNAADGIQVSKTVRTRSVITSVTGRIKCEVSKAGERAAKFSITGVVNHLISSNRSNISLNHLPLTCSSA